MRPNNNKRHREDRIMGSLYSAEHRALQEEFGSARLAGFLDEHHVTDALSDKDAAFVASRDYFFLSTVDPDGMPTVSYKGGPVGVVKALGPNELAFPGFDGNGMFYSMGNVEGQAKVGLLFIDFETPHRLRVQGTARVMRDDPLLGAWAEAKYVVRVHVTKAWVNCPRYIHKHVRVETSKYVPEAGKATPLAAWKRLDIVQDALPAEERARAENEGLLDLPSYEAKLVTGDA
jgi:predicted pyridoxine 5'-phosphate oxidase superfamily flavin-nucleotide-binding protein